MGTLKRTGNNVLTRVLVIAFVVSFLIFFFDNVQTTYNSYVDLEKEIEYRKEVPLDELVKPFYSLFEQRVYMKNNELYTKSHVFYTKRNDLYMKTGICM